jgi:hypothetical protein
MPRGPEGEQVCPGTRSSGRKPSCAPRVLPGRLRRGRRRLESHKGGWCIRVAGARNRVNEAISSLKTQQQGSRQVGPSPL